MEELISKQNAIDVLTMLSEKMTDSGQKVMMQAVGVIQSLLSIQSEIIRCKDCKHSEHWYRDKRRCFLWVEDGIDVFDDGFCNYAGRRTDE